MIKPGEKEIASKGKKRPALSCLVWALLGLLSRCSLVSCCSWCDLAWFELYSSLAVLWLPLTRSHSITYLSFPVACSAKPGRSLRDQCLSMRKVLLVVMNTIRCTYIQLYIPTLPALCLGTLVPRQKVCEYCGVGNLAKSMLIQESAQQIYHYIQCMISWELISWEHPYHTWQSWADNIHYSVSMKIEFNTGRYASGHCLCGSQLLARLHACVMSYRLWNTTNFGLHVYNWLYNFCHVSKNRHAKIKIISSLHA